MLSKDLNSHLQHLDNKPSHIEAIRMEGNHKVFSKTDFKEEVISDTKEINKSSKQEINLITIKDINKEIMLIS